MSTEIQPRITVRANVKYLDVAKVIQAFPHAAAPFSNYTVTHSGAMTLMEFGACQATDGKSGLV